MTLPADTICAVATPAGRGGVGIIRVSGPRCAALCELITSVQPTPGRVQYAAFSDPAQGIIDTGLSVFFRAPHSFTGEDVWELQTHGSPVVLDLLLQLLVRCGCRLARPGEFSERAFLNDKLDLAQAEAIADLIDSRSAAAARNALRSLQGEFSRLVNALVDEVTKSRIYVEAAIDFPDEEVDFLSGSDLHGRLERLRSQLTELQARARQGALLREGIRVVIAGEPNAGKSTLLNALAGMDAAIVTDIPGTTRDLLRQEISLNGVPIHVVDTAGLRSSEDPVELEGIRRARGAIAEADRVLLVADARKQDHLEASAVWKELRADVALEGRLSIVANKTDLTSMPPGIEQLHGLPLIRLSAKTGAGMDLLRQHILDCVGYQSLEEGGFIARRRHLDALERAGTALTSAQAQLANKAGELLAEDLRRAQDALGEITGAVTADDLLGRIFSTFCIGK